MGAKTTPLVFSKFHPLPVVVAGSVLAAELDSPGFPRSTFCAGDMSLKLDSPCSCFCDRIDEGMRQTQTAVMSLPHLGNDKTSGHGKRRRSRLQTGGEMELKDSETEPL